MNATVVPVRTEDLALTRLITLSVSVCPGSLVIYAMVVSIYIFNYFLIILFIIL